MDQDAEDGRAANALEYCRSWTLRRRIRSPTAHYVLTCEPLRQLRAEVPDRIVASSAAVRIRTVRASLLLRHAFCAHR